MGVKSPETARGNMSTAKRRPGNFQSPSARMNIEKYLVAQIKAEIIESDSKSGIASGVAEATESTTAVGSTGAVSTTLDVSPGSNNHTNSGVPSNGGRQKENVPQAGTSVKARKRVRTTRKRPIAMTAKSPTDFASPGTPSGGRVVDSNGNLITNYFPLRRSHRRTKAEVIKSKELMMEDKIVREDESGFEIVKYEDKGRGVISTIEVKAGDFVLEYAGDLINLREARRREQQ